MHNDGVEMNHKPKNVTAVIRGRLPALLALHQAGYTWQQIFDSLRAQGVELSSLRYFKVVLARVREQSKVRETKPVTAKNGAVSAPNMAALGEGNHKSSVAQANGDGPVFGRNDFGNNSAVGVVQSRSLDDLFSGKQNE